MGSLTNKEIHAYRLVIQQKTSTVKDFISPSRPRYAPALSEALSNIIPSHPRPRPFWREHKSTPLNLMRQSRRSFKSAYRFDCASPRTLSQQLSPQWTGPQSLVPSKQRDVLINLSGWPFGHYKAGLQSQHVSYLQALQATLVVKQGIVIERWLNGLLVMLEKIFSCSLITKL